MTEKIKFTEEDKRNLFDHKDHKYDCSNEGACEAYTKLDGVWKFFAYMSVMKKNGFNLSTLEGSIYTFFERGQKCAREAAKSFGDVKDPDSGSELVQKVYAALWDDICYNPCMRTQGETMNSVNTTLNEYYKYKLMQNEDESNRFKESSQRMSILYILSSFFEHHEDFSRERDNMSFLWGGEFERFVSVYHTIGNFIPVPWGCNGPRGRATVNDYWDLTLWNIHKYYTEGKTPEYIKNILSKPKYGDYDTLVQRYKRWLDSFGDWENFVNKNYLRAFVEYREDKNNIYPKELWKGHFDDYKTGNALPEDDKQCKEYFKNAADWIEKRTETMIEKLKEIINESENGCYHD